MTSHKTIPVVNEMSMVMVIPMSTSTFEVNLLLIFYFLYFIGMVGY